MAAFYIIPKFYPCRREAYYKNPLSMEGLSQNGYGWMLLLLWWWTVAVVVCLYGFPLSVAAGSQLGHYTSKAGSRLAVYLIKRNNCATK